MSKRTKSRLGKGLSGLIGQPVPVEPGNTTPTQVSDTPKQAGVPTGHGADADAMPRPETPVSIDATPVATDNGAGLEGGRRMRAIDCRAIEPNPYQPRRAFDVESLEALARSIQQSGVIQPIAVRTARGESDKAWEIVAGERRWRAAQRAGLQKIPAVIVDLSERETAAWALVENLQREDLNPIERADALKALADQFSLTHQQIAEQVGLDRATVSNLIRLTELEPEIRLLVTAPRGEGLSGGHAKALLAIEESASRVAMAKSAASEGWSVRTLERAIASAKGGGGKGTPPRPVTTPTPDPVISDVERQLGQQLGTKVRIDANTARTKGRIIIDYYDVDHFGSLLEQMGVKIDS